MGSFEGTLQAFGNACQELEDSPENFNIRLEILAELASSVPKEKSHGQCKWSKLVELEIFPFNVKWTFADEEPWNYVLVF